MNAGKLIVSEHNQWVNIVRSELFASYSRLWSIAGSSSRPASAIIFNPIEEVITSIDTHIKTAKYWRKGMK